MANGSAQQGGELFSGRGGVWEGERGMGVSAFGNALHGDPLNDCMKNVAAFHGRPHKAAIRQCQLAIPLSQREGGER